MTDEQQRKPSLGDRFARRTGASGLTSTGPLPIVHEPMAQPSVTSQLTGNLKDKSIAFLLQVIDHFEATGQLNIGGFQYTVVIQFGLGKPIHAFSPFNTGTEAILELFTWQDGKISFQEGVQPERPTVDDSAPQILTLGDEYVRNQEFLRNLEITELSYLLRSAVKLNEQELEKVLLSGAPLNMKMQKEFYGNIYGTMNVKDIAIKMNLSESRWMATVANLLRLGLILTPDGRTLEATGYTAPPAKPTRPAPTGAELKNMISADLNAQGGMHGGNGMPGGNGMTGGSGVPGGSGMPANGMQHHNSIEAHHGPQHSAPSGAWTSAPKAGGAAPLMPPSAVFGGGAPPKTQDVTQPFATQPQPLTMQPGAFASSPQQEHQTPSFPSGLQQPGLPQPGFQQSGSPQSSFPQPGSAQTSVPQTGFPQTGMPLPPTLQAPPAMAATEQIQAASAEQAPLKSFHLGIPDEIVLFSGLGSAAVLSHLTRPETGILRQDAFEFFLEREFSRAFRFGAAFTFMPFCITVSATGWPVLPIESVALITQALNKMRREVDILGHFGERSFAFILPGVESSQGCGLVDRIAATLPQCIPELAHYAPILHFGIASVPQDAQDLTGLVAGGQRAMLEAAKRNVTRIRFIEIASPTVPEPSATPPVPGQMQPPDPPPQGSLQGPQFPVG